MYFNNDIKSMEAEIFKNADKQIKKIQTEQKLKSELKSNSTTYNQKDINSYIGDKSITLIFTLLILVYIVIFKRKTIISKIIMYVLLFIALNNAAAILILKFSINSLFKEVIGLAPILIMAWIFMSKRKRKVVIKDYER